ncbi:MAG: hypothetical protein AAFW98_15110 [Pseudomonadota bacterium]
MTTTKILVTAALAAAVLAGCQSSRSSEPTASVRTEVATAPADLQLLCASEASTRLNVDAGNVLPVSSAQTAPNQYQVDLTLGDGNARCVVDDDANIISLERLTA